MSLTSAPSTATRTAEVAQGGDGAIDRDLGGRGRAERLRHVGHHIREQRRLPFSFLGAAVGARGDAGRDDLADGEGDVLFLLAPVPGPADVLVAEDADDLSADADGGVEQRADVTRGQVGPQVARPLVPGSVFDRQDRGPADLLEVGGGVGAAELESPVESLDALAIAELADDRGREAKAPVAHAFDAEHVAVDPQDLLKSRLPVFTGQRVQMDERLGARVQRGLHH